MKIDGLKFYLLLTRPNYELTFKEMSAHEFLIRAPLGDTLQTPYPTKFGNSLCF